MCFYKMVPRYWIISLWGFYEFKRNYDVQNSKGKTFLVVKEKKLCFFFCNMLLILFGVGLWTFGGLLLS